ncbi:hypothetical protein, partial [Aneurinibacillus migulanus]|uniref:hypothetical protein n=1 Tax=Aneurinibacillus migulanus TaxID=47500 RepID=UPI0005B820A9
GKYDSALYDSSGGLQNYQYHRSPSYENVEAGKRIAVQNADVSNIVVYGAYDVFRVQERTNPVTFKKTLASGTSMEAKNSAKQPFSLYMSGLHDYVKYDKEGRITDNKRNASNTSTGVSSGERFVLTNANSSTITVEGAYDAFT